MATPATPTKTRPLFEIAADLVKLNALLDEIEGDLSRLGEMEPLVTEWMDALALEEGAKLDSYIHIIRIREQRAAVARAHREQFQAEANRWAAVEKSNESAVDQLMARMKQAMEMQKRERLETAAGRTIVIQKTGGDPPVIVDQELYPIDEVPAEYVRVKKELDLVAIKAALKVGGELPIGLAKFGERKTTLKIK